MKHSLALIAVTFVLALPREGEARLFQLYLQGQGGYSDGSGETQAESLLGEVAPTRQDFYEMVNGSALGAEAGITLIGINLYANFLQFADSGTVTKIVLGMRPEFDPGDEGGFTFFVRLGAGAMIATFGGDSPLAAEVGKTPLGFTARGGAGISYQIFGPFEIGPQFDIGYYRLLNGTIAPDPQAIQRIEAACLEGNRVNEECVRREYAQLAGQEGLGYETSSGIDWSLLLALRLSFGT